MTDYYPDPDQWQSIDPTDAGFNPQKFAAALAFAATQEIATSNDLTAMIPKGERHPYDRQLGPLKDRSAAAGIVVKNGCLVGHFGPVDSVEVTFSATKSYISAVAGLAYDLRGSYVIAFAFFGALAVLASLLAVRVRPPVHPEPVMSSP